DDDLPGAVARVVLAVARRLLRGLHARGREARPALLGDARGEHALVGRGGAVRRLRARDAAVAAARASAAAAAAAAAAAHAAAGARGGDGVGGRAAGPAGDLAAIHGRDELAPE